MGGDPRFEQRSSYNRITRGEETTNGLLIASGELFCSGCVSEVVVMPIYDNGKSWKT